MYGQIYLITNRVNGKRYVGLTRQTLPKRWQEHIYTAKTKRTKSLIAKAIAKYGKDCFCMEPLFFALDKEALTEAEKYFIRVLSPTYNLTNGGELTEGKRKPVWSEKSKEKVRAGARKYMASLTPEERESLLARRKEAQLATYKARGHRPQSAEHRAKLAKSREEQKKRPGYNAVQVERMAAANRARKAAT